MTRGQWTIIVHIRMALKRIFMPWAYYRDEAMDYTSDTYNPESGAYWQPKAEGGLLLMQAQDEGYKLGFKEGVASAVTEVMRGNHLVLPVKYDYRILIQTMSRITEIAFLHELTRINDDGWELVSAISCTEQERYKPMLSMSVPAVIDKVVFYLRRPRKEK